MGHDDVIKWKHFPRNWPFVGGIHRPPVNSPHIGQWRGTLVQVMTWSDYKPKLLQWNLYKTTTEFCGLSVVENKPSQANHEISWRRHQMETFSVLLTICTGNSSVKCEFPTQRPVTWSFDVFFDLRLNKWLSKQSWCCDLRRHRGHHDASGMVPGAHHVCCTGVPSTRQFD